MAAAPHNARSRLRRGLAALAVAAGTCLAAPVGLEEAVARAARATGGRVLAAVETREDGRLVYEIRILTRDGRVRHLRVDPESGRVLPPPKEEH